ncbi:hypothetical protein MOX02_29460 [Methylobacterium oxalidis]|uniref:Uncharacterized protein n=1 Tax=Methylobacterium oxalidis TaxID=944322 RepID=A0A512J4K7_9HYPH|nr:hypothetical protein MOX02_29460 [Methylobacterium oxalidis]GJE34719.1 hypothetical protein LDDCCGHA_4933 [Methylobacterium oxalidis]GLS67039.1 hypothetical protein GCM10007888_54220 [Methylobacterium oxalidis]
MTITALLNRSLVNLQRRSDSLARRKALSREEGRYGFSARVMANRAQEAELLVRGYLPRPADASAGEAGSHLGGWRFHR